MQIGTFLETLRFRRDRGSSGIGTVEKFYLTCFPGNYGFSIVPYFTLPLNEAITPNFLQKMQSALDSFDVLVRNENDVLILIHNHSLAFLRPAETQRLSLMLEKAVSHLKESNYTQPSVCSFCGQPDPDGYHYAHGVHRPCHKVCLPEEPEAGVLSHPEPLPPEDLGARLLSVILSFSLSLAGAVPAVIAAIYYPIFYTFLLIFIPLGGVLGARWGRTNVTRKTFRDLNVLAYALGIGLMLWRLNLGIASQGGFENYFSQSANIVSFLLDFAVGTLAITVGMAVFRLFLPIRRL